MVPQHCFFFYVIEQVSIECRKTKTKTKVITLANQKDGDNPVNQSQLEVITLSPHKTRGNVHARATIGFGFTSDWLKKWRENFEPITEWSNTKPKQFANYFQHSIENRSKADCITFNGIGTNGSLKWRTWKKMNK